MGMLDGKVALITGAARGQGRSHAIRLAEEGADIVAVDLCDQIDSVPYPLATTEDLDQTIKAVEAQGRRIAARTADVRDAAQMNRVVADATELLGPIDIIVANAGIAAPGEKVFDPSQIFRDIVDVNLIGVWNTVMAAVPSMRAAGKGGSIVLVSSTQGLKGVGADGTAGSCAYTATKHGVVGLMRNFTHWLANDNIRVNTIHPTGVETPMIMNDAVGAWVADNPEVTVAVTNLLPVSMIAPEDVSDAVLWLVSDHAKYVAGVALPVDAGFSAK
ncbi:mycofactocin-coupled SDR family oxidoreductase [Mycobacterium montefiorense]|uniref:mycofactocin-coupled SDR family oxidoreductase n=1 Tax=Mycobacterium montefiorense TaxID=154654 RepID=UPI0021F28701|nr:mycofactocin-coupled SDR family oxidoreductase [Mycobacterium montefiorense]MCV7425801.1 mycofactocin-coupled SDR family oxidoreductase [Mycobacterium montefiorense]